MEVLTVMKRYSNVWLHEYNQATNKCTLSTQQRRCRATEKMKKERWRWPGEGSRSKGGSSTAQEGHMDEEWLALSSTELATWPPLQARNACCQQEFTGQNRKHQHTMPYILCSGARWQRLSACATHPRILVLVIIPNQCVTWIPPRTTRPSGPVQAND